MDINTPNRPAPRALPLVRQRATTARTPRVPASRRALHHPPRDETFTLRPRGAGGFGAVAVALERKLRSVALLPGRNAVIVEISEPPHSHYGHYTQTLIDAEAGAWVEAVSNEFILEEAAFLDDDDHKRLELIGFDPPDDFSPNHYRLLAPPVDWSHVARLLIEPLVPVYRAAIDTELTVIVSEIS